MKDNNTIMLEAFDLKEYTQMQPRSSQGRSFKKSGLSLLLIEKLHFHLKFVNRKCKCQVLFYHLHLWIGTKQAKNCQLICWFI